MLTVQSNAVTMSSLELVAFINSQRGEGEAELRHDHFMNKVPKVLGVEGSPKFLGHYTHPQNGQEYPCYNFPKREACLMAMSYSYDLQAKVFDRMTELESKQPTQPALGTTPAMNAMLLAPAAMEAMKAFGFTGNQAVLSANKAITAVTEIDLLAISGNTHLIAEKKALTFTPTQLGAMLDPPISAKAFNKRLFAADLQFMIDNAWTPTKAGLRHCEVLDTGKKHSSGIPIKQVKWYESVMDLIS